MSGHKAFDNLVTEMDKFQDKWTKFISREEFEEWREYYIWDALHGLRYGQSFCNRFGLKENNLYYVIESQEQADIYIEKTYIDRS